ncbi:MAG: trimeric intracellular cation channel family protein [Chitinophagaceae bacterium]|nr:trimeric intracellular cation channel family protein [Chitinophagaceae bacterium]MCW5926083.1 trimeric intracellular cation channel family protein [Chitinophagaceae bacterium]
MKTEILRLIDIFGIVAFSISGALAGMQKRLDLFGIFVIAFITAMGGGTLRDILIGDLPVSWMKNSSYAIIIFVSALAAIFFNSIIQNYQKLLLVFDSIGLGFFTLSGIQKGMDFGFQPGVCIALGTFTACFGGVIRDISLNNIPLIFQQKEIYATTCIIGGIVYFLLLKLQVPYLPADIICVLIIFLTRMLAVRYKLRLPVLYRKPKSDDP